MGEAMTRYAVTFGSQYGREIHPVFPMLTHFSFVTLEAPDYDTAHGMAMRLFNGRFAFLYRWDRHQVRPNVWDSFPRQIEEYGLVDHTTDVLSYLVAGDRLHGAVKMDHVREE